MFPLIHIIEDFVMDKFKSTLPDDVEDRYDSLVDMFAGGINA